MEAHPLRKCKDCGLESSDLTLFVKDKGSKHGRRNLCLSCVVKRNEAHPKCKDWKTDHQTKKRYGVTAEEYKEKMKTADSCVLCGSTANLCYDHNHATMKFRGVLCRACNTALGLFRDNPDLLRKAAAYVEKHKDGTEP
jgi:hypothetical protein